mmetsp:Transcript_45932/g.130229  ORF Transcript_45932/g.130229 Transcript_45932/m.130229 type:complete len:220 (+) Transcript_45932:589-1248(+)
MPSRRKSDESLLEWHKLEGVVFELRVFRHLLDPPVLVPGLARGPRRAPRQRATREREAHLSDRLRELLGGERCKGQRGLGHALPEHGLPARPGPGHADAPFVRKAREGARQRCLAPRNDQHFVEVSQTPCATPGFDDPLGSRAEVVKKPHLSLRQCLRKARDFVQGLRPSRLHEGRRLRRRRLRGAHGRRPPREARELREPGCGQWRRVRGLARGRGAR